MPENPEVCICKMDIAPDKAAQEVLLYPEGKGSGDFWGRQMTDGRQPDQTGFF